MRGNEKGSPDFRAPGPVPSRPMRGYVRISVQLIRAALDTAIIAVILHYYYIRSRGLTVIQDAISTAELDPPDGHVGNVYGPFERILSGPLLNVLHCGEIIQSETVARAWGPRRAV